MYVRIAVALAAAAATTQYKNGRQNMSQSDHLESYYSFREEGEKGGRSCLRPKLENLKVREREILIFCHVMQQLNLRISCYKQSKLQPVRTYVAEQAYSYIAGTKRSPESIIVLSQALPTFSSCYVVVVIIILLGYYSPNVKSRIRTYVYFMCSSIVRAHPKEEIN